MSANAELVEAAIAHLNRGDWEAALEHAAPDFELDFSRATGLVHGVFDLATAPQVFAEYAGMWESSRLEVEELITAGDDVVVPMTVRVTGRDGIEVTSRPTYVFTIRDGALARLCMYQEREEALAEIGVSEG